MEDIHLGRHGGHVLSAVVVVLNLDQGHAPTPHHSMVDCSVLEQALVHKPVTHTTVQVRFHDINDIIRLK